MQITTVAAAPAEPITKAQARTAGRIPNDSDEDAYLDTLIAGARVYAEDLTSYCFIQRTLRFTFEKFPDGKSKISLPRRPVQSISEIKYIDSDGNEQTWAAENYNLKDLDADPAVMLAFGKSYPDNVRQAPNSVWIDAVCGFAPGTSSPIDYAENVPRDIILALYSLIGHWYDNRSAVVLNGTPKEIPLGANELLFKYRKIHV